MSAPTRRISQIRVGKRHRRDLGDVPELADSIRDLGLLQPITITPAGDLIAGERRLEACKRLGLESIPVHVVNIDAIVRGEAAENFQRKDFTPSEMVAIAAAVEKRERELAKARQVSSLKRGDQKPVGKTLHHGGKTRDKVAAPLGISGVTLERARAVVASGDRSLIAEMDRTGKVNAAYRSIRRAKDEKRILGLAPVAGKFRTLVIDPSWEYENDFLGRSKPDYATMSKEELLALPVGSWAEDNAHLYLWSTNAMLRAAFDLMDAWGFRYNTLLTWKKPSFGTGSNFRQMTEHCLFGIRGTLSTRRQDIGTCFEAPKTVHSEKPDKFYEIVRAASYPPYGEAFQRKARPDFVNLYARVASGGGAALDLLAGES